MDPNDQDFWPTELKSYEGDFKKMEKEINQKENEGYIIKQLVEVRKVQKGTVRETTGLLVLFAKIPQWKLKIT